MGVSSIQELCEVDVIDMVSDSQFGKLEHRVTLLERQEISQASGQVLSPNLLQSQTSRIGAWYDRHAGLVALVGVLATIVIGLVGIVFFVVPHIENDIRSNLTPDMEKIISGKRLDALPQQVTSLQSSVDAMRHDLDLLLQKGLKISSSLPQESFKRNLDTVATQLHLATERNVGLDHDTLRALSEKLRNTPETSPGYWPTVLQFIQLASSAYSPDVPQRIGQHVDMRIDNSFGTRLQGIKGQVILLDGGSLIDSDLTNCRIIFTQNPVKMQNVKFINCVFELPVSKRPNPYLKRASQQLLASDLRSVSMNNS